MKILLMSRAFSPSVGGIETASMIFATGLATRGHDVTVVTSTPGEEQKNPFRIVRNPGAAELLRLVATADVVWQNNVSLRTLWAPFLFSHRFFITHQTWLGSNTWFGYWLGALKRLACIRARNIFISNAVAKAVRLPGIVIPNPYDDLTFSRTSAVERDRDIVFVGRLVESKGCNILIDALEILAARNIHARTTIIGDGPSASRLKEQAMRLSSGRGPVFLGSLTGSALATELNRHRILVVPSTWNEPFGIVALEGAACGCVVVGTAGGGLPEAIGPCGLAVVNSDPAALADALASLLDNPNRQDAYRRNAPAHLAKFTAGAIIDAYEACLVNG